MPRRNREIEIKLVVASPRTARRRLRELGLRLLAPRALEQNTLFDTWKRSLRRRGQMLRLRRVGPRAWLTLKQPAQASQRYKVRQEFETEIQDPWAVERALLALGYGPVFRYQKFRTVYGAGRGRQGGEVMLDETPIGTFLELEGPRRWILRLAGRLGARPADFLTQTYAELYRRWCRRHHRPFRHMIFPARFLP